MQDAYAQALWEMIEGGTAPKKAVKAVHEALAARGRLGLLSRIARAFSRIAARSNARDTVVLHVARAKDGNRAQKEAASMLKDAGIKAGDVEIRADENLIGGWRLEGREVMHDASYKRQLLDMYERVLENNE
ncbi:MAG: F0F1 ATP synthase subunit delta [bacterium]|nr:F0F1 ATP synthase subunit delta [bacterium]